MKPLLHLPLRLKRLRHHAIAGLACACLTSPLIAGDFGDEPFETRVGLSLSRTSNYPDTVARQASVAYPLGSASNPAGDDALREPPFDFTTLGAVSNSYLLFDSELAVVAGSATLVHRLPEKGTLSATYIRTESTRPQGAPGFLVTLRSNEGLLGYSETINDDLTLGLSGNITDSSLGITTPVTDLENDSITTSLDIGALYTHSDTVKLGLILGGSYSWIDTEGTAFGFPVSTSSEGYGYTVTTGASWAPKEGLIFVADASYRHGDSDASGSFDYGRFLFGAEWFAQPWLALRGGASTDTAGHFTPSAGLGIYRDDFFVIEFAYVYNAFPEVKAEFGNAHFLTIGTVIEF